MELMNIDNTVLMSSREISELTGKRHDNVLVDIRRMLNEIQSPEKSGDYLDDRNRKQTMLLLNKEECLCLISGYSIKLRMSIINRWKELEEERVKPKTQNEIIAAMALANVENERKLLAIQQETDEIKKETQKVKQEVENIKEGNIPEGYQGYSVLSSKYGFSKPVCKRLVEMFDIECKKIPFSTPVGSISYMTVVNEEEFKRGWVLVIDGAERRKSRYYYEGLGTFQIK